MLDGIVIGSDIEAGHEAKPADVLDQPSDSSLDTAASFDMGTSGAQDRVRSNNSTQGSSLPQQGPRGESFRRIKDHFSSGAPGSTRLTARDGRLQPAHERCAHGTGMRADAPADHHPSDFVCTPSGCLTIIVAQHSAQPLAAADVSSATNA